MSDIWDSLRRLSNSVEETAHAWEERGYWTKADSFRREWAWLEPTLGEFESAMEQERPAGTDLCTARLLVRLIQLGVARPGGVSSPSRGRPPT